MAHGRPDFQLAVDIEAQTLADLDINIVAQTLGEVNVNLAASAITLNVNLASSAITLNVNISSTTAALSVNLTASAITLNINISAQAVAIRSQGEFSAQAGADLTYQCSGSNKSFGQGATVTHTVPVGKTLYITSASMGIWAYAAASADLPQHGILEIKGDAAIILDDGGDGGFGVAFPTPLKFVAGVVFSLGVYCMANHACNISATANGYEI